MTVTIDEKPTSRSATEGVDSNAQTTLEYIVRGTDDDSAVHAIVQATIPAFYRGLSYQSYSIDPVHVDQSDAIGFWDISAQYGVKDPNESTYAFDTGGGTQHITQSLVTKGRYPAPGFVAPDFGGAIGVTHEDVEGVDITVPIYNFSETHYIDDALVTNDYKGTLFFLTGKTNDAPFRNFAVGEVLFLGAAGTKRGREDWEITFKFAASPNVVNLQIGPITIAFKGGWDLLWVRYTDVEDKAARMLVKRPVAAYVEQVYKEGDYLAMGI